MWKRIASLTRASLAGEWLGESGQRIPIAPVLFQFSLAAALCLLARSELSAYGYALFGLSIPLALLALPLLGELGPLLLADPAEDWVAALPVRPVERRIARVLVLGILLGSLALGSLLPVAVLAPAEFTLPARFLLVVAGLAQSACLAAALLWVQALLGRRAEGLLVGLQTALFAAVLVGFVASVRLFPVLAKLEDPTSWQALNGYPPAWFANWSVGAWSHLAWFGLGATALAALTFAVSPFPPRPTARKTGSALATLLIPLRTLAQKLWVRPSERGIFDFVYEALPAERDFVIRAYPLVGAPLALLLLGAEPGDPRGEGLFALLLFSPAIYLPVMLLYVPATATPEARWLLDCSPLTPEQERGGATKALFVRFLAPLYLLLTVIAALEVGWAWALSLAPAAALTGRLASERLWSLCVSAPPLSTAPGDLASAWKNDFTGLLFGVGLGVTFLSIAAWRTIPTLSIGLGIGVAWWILELTLARLPQPANATSEQG